jgi:hypothetical protein
MAPLPDWMLDADGILAVRSASEEHRIPDARRIAAEYLGLGHHSQEFLDLVAEVLEIKKEKGKTGRKKQKAPIGWYDIGKAFENLRDSKKSGGGGFSYLDAIEELANSPEGLGYKRGALVKRVGYFLKAKEKSDEIWWEGIRT